jgi:hypothetical protein
MLVMLTASVVRMEQDGQAKYDYKTQRSVRLNIYIYIYIYIYIWDS